MRSLMWFREQDLRIHDNTALYHASLHSDDGLIAVFIISPEEWKQHDMAPIRQDFILRHLSTLKDELHKSNIELLILTAEKKSTIPSLLLNIAQQFKVDQLFFNDQFEIDERKRDEEVTKQFIENNIKVHRYVDQIILAPDEIKTQSGKPYTIFTPFKKTWIKRFQECHFDISLLKPKKTNPIPSDLIQSWQTKHELENVIIRNNKNFDKSWEVGESFAQQKLKIFIESKIKRYDINRDFPALDGTSTLSPYLTSGIISARQCLKQAMEINHNKLDSGNNGITTWISELLWREFYKYILFYFPRVCMHRAFQPWTENIRWRNNENEFEAWKSGNTGIPIVDAGMHQLNQTGWMHNRCRMIVAMFLTKNLLIDWRWGEQYFMQHLIDGDLASNNGGWQWAASTGTDAVPYFRIFNPETQAKRFDPQNEFIQKYCNEKNYPKPIVNLADSRKRAIAVFKQAQ